MTRGREKGGVGRDRFGLLAQAVMSRLRRAVNVLLARRRYEQLVYSMFVNTYYLVFVQSLGRLSYPSASEPRGPDPLWFPSTTSISPLLIAVRGPLLISGSIIGRTKSSPADKRTNLLSQLQVTTRGHSRKKPLPILRKQYTCDPNPPTLHTSAIEDRWNYVIARYGQHGEQQQQALSKKQEAADDGSEIALGEIFRKIFTPTPIAHCQ
ncbi:uncharacterized protein B0T23DRAFT_399134 [Neurospora hispaniola]|uniref:Uncharacterized protein n=1 Tax=Neurospora hispaniola TaxID=588809 RepID=A0AAJ0MMV5_9PEZI|nr:hypothetical protein B0T23DRAFT_399134 [Neurospora hispaniola]